MSSVVSKDGTTIGYTKTGSGPALIFVDGALNYRKFSMSDPLAKLLSEHFTVYTYDRRGRGESGDTLPYSVEREIDDLEAIIDAAGGTAQVLGTSSGAILALEAANKLTKKISRAAAYEAPMIIDDSRPPLGAETLKRAKQFIAEGKRDETVKLFMRAIEVPPFMLFLMRIMPTWKSVRAIAHTIVYDLEIASAYQEGKPLPKGLWSNVTIPVWVGVGGKSTNWMTNAQKMLAETLPNATLHSLPGQNHMVQAAAIAPELIEFFKV